MVQMDRSYGGPSGKNLVRISRGMTEHLQNGVLKDHMINSHKDILRKAHLVKIPSALRYLAISRNRKYMKY